MRNCLVIVMLALVLPACSSMSIMDKNGVDLMNAGKVYTIVNLHPDETNQRLYSVNYQQDGLLPRCTEVVIEDASKKALIFTVPSRSDRRYTYLWHKRSTPEGLSAHLAKFFASSCDSKAVKKLSAKDQKGIKEGKAMVGMSRQGVLLAMGPPPSHVNFNQETASEWIYWRHRFSKRAIEFDQKGLVKNIR